MYDYKPHFLSRWTIAAQNFYHNPQRAFNKWCDVENVIVWQEQKVVSIVQFCNMVNLLLTQIPIGVKLVNCKASLFCESRAKAYANKTLKTKGFMFKTPRDSLKKREVTVLRTKAAGVSYQNVGNIQKNGNREFKKLFGNSSKKCENQLKKFGTIK